MFSSWFFILFTGEVALSRVLDSGCIKDNDCLSGFYCHKSTCKKCLKCQLLFRKGDSCITDFSNCGNCLEGFEEPLLTNFSNVTKPCVSIKKKVKYKTCADDNSCPQNSYCNEDECIQCFDCGLFNRNTLSKCARSIADCGSCFQGFNEVAVTIDTNLKPCEKEFPTLASSTMPFRFTMDSLAPVFLIILILAATAYALIFKKYRNKIICKTPFQEPIHPSAPPLYTLDTSTQCIQKLEEDKCVVKCVQEKKQEAKVFKQPDAEYYYAGSENESIESSTGSSMNPVLHSRSFAGSFQIRERSCSPGILVHQYFEHTDNGIITDSPVLPANDVIVERRNSNESPLNVDVLDSAQNSETHRVLPSDNSETT